jgi:Mg2+/Co2+ transporter CorC
MSKQTISEIQDENDRLKALVAFLRDELEELIGSIDEEFDIEDKNDE